jgi:hypothetical protein
MSGYLHRLLDSCGRELIGVLDSVGALTGVPSNGWQLVAAAEAERDEPAAVPTAH